MADNSKSEGSNEYKMAENFFSYGTMIKLNGLNCQIWSKVFIMSVAGHRKKYIIEEDEPTEKKGIYVVWDEDNYIVMSWIMNSVESHIAPTIAYYTKANEMWFFSRKTYSHATNVIKILQLEEELCNIKLDHGYFATLTAAYERIKALRPPCQHCYALHYETEMVAKFLSDLSPEYSVAKSQILTGSDLPDLADTYNRPSCLAVTISHNMHDTPVSALVISGGRGLSSFGGLGDVVQAVVQDTVDFSDLIVAKLDRCWDKHPHLCLSFSSGRGGGRIAIGKGPSSSQAAHSKATVSMVETSTNPSISMSYSLNLSKDEYDRVLAQRSASTSASTSTNATVIDSTFSVGTPTDDPEEARLTRMLLIVGEGGMLPPNKMIATARRWFLPSVRNLHSCSVVTLLPSQLTCRPAHQWRAAI
ncbi:hypothetical protein EJ110_NYTH41272 [Nymphaea thermarum]|nr:hypothetical protein EJ110_NYTH41272 [Nymphaea thermarum]